ncbi:TetR/AcrR family transcriptional regulator [Aureimonas altamirensis]|uniref:TetR/AcrR family transcriptional regulator n=1 Tax=Aureimonas altamirensis TaxID=370622 RepID=UPI002036DCC3|nr:TetR/AcrR family transcriptional regulator [Aureimonas altamirensis]MCM2502653.1 TetR/AcrR family transcriptional regulator [Aureimonas altamirensis]
MNKHRDIITGAEAVFDGNGFRATGVDAFLAPSGASTRTLYKHFGSRDGLVLAVLDHRHRAFMARLAAGRAAGDPVAALFDTLENWMSEHGPRGCMLLRARAEYEQANAAIVDLVARQKAEFEEEVAERVAGALGKPNSALTRQVWILFEGATAAAPIAGLGCIEEARRAADALIRSVREQSR